MALMQDLEERLMRNVDIDQNGCWVWKRHKNPQGYGQMGIGSMTFGTKRTALAHRVSYEHFKGKIKPGLTIDHLCRVRACINPNHLEAVTNKENISRGNPLWKQEAARTHCKYGHKFTDDNIYKSSRGNGRNCRQCMIDRTQICYAIKKLDKMIGIYHG